MELSMEPLTPTPAPPVQKLEEWRENPRLPTHVQAKHYDLLLKPYLELGWFRGKETMSVTVTEELTYFVVHAKQLKIISSTVTGSEGHLKIKSSFLYPPHDFWVVEMEKPVEPGNYSLDFEYVGTLNSKTFGFFAMTYPRSREGDFGWLAASIFVPGGARQTFLCFDEPSLRATYRLRIRRPAEHYMSIASETSQRGEYGPGQNQITDCFAAQQLPPFLTYFIMMNMKEAAAFEELETKGSKVILRLFTAPEYVHKISFALEIATQCFRFFNDYFEIPFPLTELDFIGIPNFPADATHHGVIIPIKGFCHTFGDGISSYEEGKRIRLAVADALLKQWFGKIVVVKWWDETWLIESFCTFMKYKVFGDRREISKNWIPPQQFFVDCIYPMLDEDSMLHCNPIGIEAKVVQGYEGNLSPTTHKKGAAIIRMLEAILGEEGFRRGVQKYLNDHAWSSATVKDFCHSLNSECQYSSPDLISVIDSWINQPGYPVINVIRRGCMYILSQNRFLSDHEPCYEKEDSPYRFSWNVPVYYGSSKDVEPTMVWLTKSGETVKIELSDRALSYMKFNLHQMCPFRVNYEGCLLLQFSIDLVQDHTKFNAVDRANLLDDAFVMAEVGHVDYKYTFEMLRYLVKERDYLPWAVALRHLKRLLHRISYLPSYNVLQKIVRSLISTLYGNAKTQFNWSMGVESQFDGLLGAIILELGCLSNLEQCIADLGLKFKEWITTGALPVSTYLRKMMLFYGMREAGTLNDLETVKSRYKEEFDQTVKNELLRCMANTKYYWVIARFLEDPENELDNGQYLIFLQYLADNPHGRPLAWEFIKNKWEFLIERFGPNNPMLMKALSRLAGGHCFPRSIEETIEFFKKHGSICSDEESIKMVIQKVKNQAIWIRKLSDDCAKALRDYLNHQP